MQKSLYDQILLLNPWLINPATPISQTRQYVERTQEAMLRNPEWDSLWTVLVGPRQSGKTTMGKHLCEYLITQKRFSTLLYLNCDFLEVRNWLKTPLFIQEALETFNLQRPILFIDEVQRIENPGLLLKTIYDLRLPIKCIATGSSQLEIKSTVQEHLTGRHLECLVLPFSFAEARHTALSIDNFVLYGGYPSITQSTAKEVLLSQLFKDYISKDIVDILRIGKPDIMQKLISLIAHSSGQLVDYQQLASDSQISIPTVQNYLSILEKTYVLHALRPFVGNKRTEITSNPIYYFIDNGFRNQALGNFLPLEQRTDTGLLVENTVFQEILKYQTQAFKDFNLHYWRTKGGAEVDFVLHKNNNNILPIEAKYRNLKKPTVTRGFRSFIEAYKPREGVFITKSLTATIEVDGCQVHFLPLADITKLRTILERF